MVVNLSTSLVVEDAARKAGARVVRAPVGEANVARAIRDRGAVIGGEGNGGVMYPALHIGRDAPLGVALILHLLATTGVTLSAACCIVAPVHHRQSEGAPRSGTPSDV